MPISTKAPPKKRASGPPPPKAWKGTEANQTYEERAKDLLRFAIKQGLMSYPDLSAALGKIGVEITPAALENKISRGGFSAAFLMQCMDALNTNLVALRR